MTVYFDIINLMEIYMVVNGKKKSIWRIVILIIFLMYMLKKIKNWNPPKNNYYMDLWKYG
jgi:hypothetical protein